MSARTAVSRGGVAWTAVAMVLALQAACGGGPGGAGGDAATGDGAGAKRRHYEGRMRLGDRWLEVTPVVINDAKMDLATLCQLLRDEEKKAGKAEAGLCYGPERRAAAAVKTLRVELHKGSFGDVMKALAAKAEGAHVVADKTGTIYQILDFALAARRDGSVREGEVRIVAVEDRGKTAAQALLEELKPVFPGALVETVSIAAPAPVPHPEADTGPRPGTGSGASDGDAKGSGP